MRLNPLRGGFEYAVTSAITVGGEYRYTHFSEKNVKAGVTPGGAVPSTPPGPITLNLDTHQITPRVNDFFGRP